MAKIVEGAGYQRRPLYRSLPLKSPFALHVFVSSICNLKCGYCLHSLESEKKKDLLTRQKLMERPVFDRIVEEMKRFAEPMKAVIFAGWGEPLMHPDLPAMIAGIKAAGVAERIEVVSNGVLLTRRKADDLIASGLDRIRISIQGVGSEKCREVTNVPFDFDKLVDNISYFFSKRRHCAVYVKTVDQVVPDAADKERFHSIFGGICDEIAIENIIPVIEEIDHSTFGSRFEKRHCGGLAKNVVVCPFPFYMAVVHPDGSYAPCCAPEFPDIFSGRQPASLYDVWGSERLRQFRLSQLRGKRGGMSVCRSCVRPKYDSQQEDILDDWAERLIPKY